MHTQILNMLSQTFPFSMLSNAKRKQARDVSATPFITETVPTEMMVILMADSTIYWAFLAFSSLHYSLIPFLFP